MRDFFVKEQTNWLSKNEYVKILSFNFISQITYLCSIKIIMIISFHRTSRRITRYALSPTLSVLHRCLGCIPALSPSHAPFFQQSFCKSLSPFNLLVCASKYFIVFVSFRSHWKHLQRMFNLMFIWWMDRRSHWRFNLLTEQMMYLR